MFQTMFHGTQRPSWTRMAAAVAAAAYPTTIATITKPTTGVIFDSHDSYPSLVRILPFQTGAATKWTGVGMRIVGWTKYQNATADAWIPTVLADFTLGYTSGTVASLSIDAVTHYFLNTVTQVSGTPTANLWSPATPDAASVDLASVLVDVAGSQLIQVQFKEGSAAGVFGAFGFAI